MDDAFYEKNINCPVCESEFAVTKVKTKACKVTSRDTDYCIFYENVNPLFYDIWVCEECGYAALNDRFVEISDSKSGKLYKELAVKWNKYKFAEENDLDKYRETFIDKNCLILKNVFSPKWSKTAFSGIRTIDTAIESFKLAYYNLNIIKPTNSELAKISLRIAWLYRIKKDFREKKYLEHTLMLYHTIYEKEKLTDGKFDECVCMYMIGELSLRTGAYDDSIFWFGKLISSPLAKQNPRLLESTRDQLQIVKNKLAEAKKESESWDF